jgi:hypothetical protein
VCKQKDWIVYEDFRIFQILMTDCKLKLKYKFFWKVFKTDEIFVCGIILNDQVFEGVWIKINFYMINKKDLNKIC